VTLLTVRGPTRRHEPVRRRADEGEELARRYAEHSRRLLKLAALLVPEITTANELMYEAFANMYQARGRVRRADDVFAFLLRDVVYRARALMEAQAGQFLPVPGRPGPSVLDAVRALPRSQREALVLRYYGQLSDEQAAAAMGVQPAELRVHVARGMAALRASLLAPSVSIVGE
jgi:DNA-directed RNA polymerase specialized sigma24 family protein